MQRALIGFAAILLVLPLAVYLTKSPRAPIWVQGQGRGFVRRIYLDENNHQHRYVAFVPYHLSENERPPLMLFLCGFGEYDDDGVRHLVNTMGPQLWDQKSRFPFVVLFPQCRFGSDWNLDSPDVQWALAMLDEVAAEYQTDPERVYLTGTSSGGMGTWTIAAAYPDKFAAIAPLCGFPPIQSAAPLAAAHLPIWSFVNSLDKSKLVATNRGMYQALLNAGASPRYTEVNGSGHDVWNYAYRNPALYNWFLKQTRSRNAANRSTYTSIFNGHDLEGWDAGGGVWSVEPEGVLMGRTLPSPGGTTRLSASHIYGDFELHLEFQSTTGCGWLLRFSDDKKETSNSGGWALEILPSDRGSGGLFSTVNAECLQPSDSLAQSVWIPREWNDFRLRVVNGHIITWLNGWKLVDYQETSDSERSGVISLQISADDQEEVCWRNIRISEQVEPPP